MRCNKAQELFSSYLEKTIQLPMGVAFEQHLAECVRCRSAYDRFHATTIVLDELPVVEPPPDMHAVIMARVEQARRAAPGRVKWLHVDWQSAFTVRVSAKALAAAAAVLLVFVMVMQFSPLHSYMSGLLGVQPASNRLPVNQGYARLPVPVGFSDDSGVRYADVGGGLSVGVAVDKADKSATLYDISLAARGNGPIPVQVYELPEGAVGDHVHSSDLTSVRCVGRVSSARQATARILQPHSGTRAKVAMIVWKSGGRSFTEFVYLPPRFGVVAKSASVSFADAGVCRILSELSANYGAVILASGGCGAKTGSVNVSGPSVDRAMAGAARQAELDLRSLESSIYVVR